MSTDEILRGPVLLLDDDRVVCKMIGTILKAAGFDVDSICDPEECLPALSRKQYKVIITDFNMPKNNGIGIYQKAREAQHDIRGILFTGDFQIQAFSDTIQSGFDDCIPKSAARDMICQSLNESINLYDRWLSRKELLIHHNDAKCE